jgi:lipopolysaccharide/colanic/teichoic acid biosynthesis glycosyltransferase
MLIIGEKYNFTDIEQKRLNSKFKNRYIIKYKNRSSTDVIKEIENHLTTHNIQLIVLNTKAKVDNSIIKYLTNLKFDKRYKYLQTISMEHFLEKYLFKCYIPLDHNDLHYLEEIQGYSFFQKIQKKIIDLIAIVILFPILWIVKYITKRKISQQSPGSLYFTQKRVGLNNQEFECIKFRSMHEDAEKDGIKFASKDDNRSYPWGQFMRDTRLDEIPQVFNIFKNEMHLIGPRPERRYWIEDNFDDKIPYYHQRHIVKPGITGWAQVMYPYGANLDDARQKLMYDLYYIKNWNILLDIKIIIKTVLIVLNKKGI